MSYKSDVKLSEILPHGFFRSINDKETDCLVSRFQGISGVPSDLDYKHYIGPIANVYLRHRNDYIKFEFIKMAEDKSINFSDQERFEKYANELEAFMENEELHRYTYHNLQDEKEFGMYDLPDTMEGSNMLLYSFSNEWYEGSQDEAAYDITKNASYLFQKPDTYLNTFLKSISYFSSSITSLFNGDFEKSITDGCKGVTKLFGNIGLFFDKLKTATKLVGVDKYNSITTVTAANPIASSIFEGLWFLFQEGITTVLKQPKYELLYNFLTGGVLSDVDFSDSDDLLKGGFKTMFNLGFNYLPKTINNIGNSELKLDLNERNKTSLNKIGTISLKPNKKNKNIIPVFAGTNSGYDLNVKIYKDLKTKYDIYTSKHGGKKRSFRKYLTDVLKIDDKTANKIISFGSIYDNPKRSDEIYINNMKVSIITDKDKYIMETIFAASNKLLNSFIDGSPSPRIDFKVIDYESSHESSCLDDADKALEITKRDSTKMFSATQKIVIKGKFKRGLLKQDPLIGYY